MKYYSIEVSETGRYVFLPIGRGLYIRTHPACLFVACPTCRAVERAPCVAVRHGVKTPTVRACQTRTAKYRQQQASLRETDETGKILRLKRQA